MPTAEEAAAANAAWRLAAGLPADTQNTAILSSAAGQAYQANQAYLAAQRDAYNEAVKQAVAFSQPRNDLAGAHSAEYDRIVAEYNARKHYSVGSGGLTYQPTGGPQAFRFENPTSAAQIAYNVALEGGNLGKDIETKSIEGPDHFDPRPYVNRPVLPERATREDIAQYDKYGNPLNSMAAQEQALRNAQNPYGRAGYTDPKSLGDITTQRVLRAVEQFRQPLGMAGVRIASPTAMQGNVLEAQRMAAFSTPGVRDERFFGNELQKWAENFVEKSSVYHHTALDSGLPVPANPYEYQGDLALSFLKGGSGSRDNLEPKMLAALPGGIGIQQDAWMRAVAADRGQPEPKPISFQSAVNLINKAEGDYGPYARLWGGPKYVETEHNAPQFPGMDTAKSVVDGLPQPFVSVSAPTAGAPASGSPVTPSTQVKGIEPTGMVGGYYDAGGEFKKPFRSGAPPVTTEEPNIAGIPTKPIEAWLQLYGAGTDKTLSFIASVPSALTLGAIPAVSVTPFADQNRRVGLATEKPELTAARTKVTAAEQNYLSYVSGYDFKAGKSELEERAKANVNAQGLWTGSKESLDVYNQQVAQFNAAGAKAQDLYSKIEPAKQAGLSSGAYVVRNGMIVENPDMSRPYGALSDWGRSAGPAMQKMVGINISPEQFAAYDITVKSQAEVKENPSYGLAAGYIRGEEQKVRNIENAIYGFNKELFTKPEELASSAVSGLQVALLTEGVGGVVEGAAARTVMVDGVATSVPRAGIVGSGARGIQRIAATPAVTYGVPAAFIGTGVVEATHGFTAPASEASMNIGSMGAHFAAMGYGAATPFAARTIAAAQPRLGYVRTETYSLREVDQPTPLSPSGVMNRQVLTQTTTPMHLNLNIYGRDIAIVPEAIRGAPTVRTITRDVDIGTQVHDLLQGSELYPTTGARDVMLRGEITANPFRRAQDVFHVTGETRIAETALPRTYQEYRVAGQAQARLRGVSQEEAAAALMAEDAIRTTPTTGYRTADVYTTRGESMWDAVFPQVPRTGGMGVEFNVINREGGILRYTDTITGGRGGEGAIRIERDMLGAESGNIELSGSLSPETKIVQTLQQVSRDMVNRNEVSYAFDSRGNFIESRISKEEFSSTEHFPLKEDYISNAGDVGSFAHEHPVHNYPLRKAIREDATRLLQGDVTFASTRDTIQRMRWRQVMQSLPSRGDIKAYGQNDILQTWGVRGRVAGEYIVSKGGVRIFRPDASTGWANYERFGSSPGIDIRGLSPTEAGARIEAGLQSYGIDYTMVNPSERYIGRTENRRVTDVSSEIRASQDAITTQIFKDALQRRAMGNPLLEFAPEVTTRAPATRAGPYGTRFVRGDERGSTPPQSPMAPYAPATATRSTQQRSQSRMKIESTTQKQEISTATESIRSFIEPVVEARQPVSTTSTRYGQVLGTSRSQSGTSVATTALDSGIVSISSIRQQQKPVGQRNDVERTRAYMIGGDLTRKQEVTPEREYIRAFRVENTLRTDTLSDVTIRPISGITPVSGLDRVQDVDRILIPEVAPRKIQTDDGEYVPGPDEPPNPGGDDEPKPGGGWWHLPSGGGGGGSVRTRKKRKTELFSFELAEDSPVPTRFGLGGMTEVFVPGTRGVARDLLKREDIAPNRLFPTSGDDHL